MDYLNSFIIADSNHVKKSKWQNLLDSVYDKIQDILNAAIEGKDIHWEPIDVD